MKDVHKVFDHLVRIQVDLEELKDELTKKEA